MDYITVIGATDISPLEEDRIFNITDCLIKEGYSLRSGKAPGADQAAQRAAEKFSLSSDQIRDHQIFLPWKHFEKNAPEITSTWDIWDFTPEEIAAASEIAAKVHPVWENLNQAQRKFHVRNIFQPLGLDLKTPSKGLIACAPYNKDNEPTGGTRTAWKVGEMFDIPRINIRDISDRLVNLWIEQFLIKGEKLNE